METFNYNKESINKNYTKYSFELNPFNANVKSVYDVFKLFEEYTSLKNLDNSLLTSIIGNSENKELRRKFNNFHNNSIGMSAVKNNLLNNVKIDLEDETKELSDYDIIQMVKSYLEINYDDRLYRLFDKMLSNGNIMVVDKENINNSEFDKRNNSGYMLIENDKSIKTAAYIINRLERLANIKDNQNKYSDFIEVLPMYKEKKFLQNYDSNDTVNAYKMHYLKLQEAKEKISKLIQYTSYKELKKDNLVDLLNYINIVYGDLISDYMLNMPNDLYTTVVRYVKLNNYFDNKFNNLIGLTTFGLTNRTNEEYVKKTKSY